MKRNDKFLLMFFIGYFFIQLFLMQNYTLNSDEGTHTILAIFYKDILVNIKNFHSLDDVMRYAAEYAIKYPKITPIYPPLYHVLLTLIFLIKESVFLGRILNLSVTTLTAFTIYKLGLKLLDDKKVALLTSVFFLIFSTIFRHAAFLIMDVLQILTFSLVLLYYLTIKKKKVILIRDVFILGVLLSIAFITKFFSVFLIPILLFDSFFHKRRIFRYVLLSIVLSMILISPYLLFYLKFEIYKFFFKVATSQFQSRWVYFDILSNFGLFIGWFVALSTIYFLWSNRKNALIMVWFFLPMIVFMLFTDSDIRFAYILMPIYAISCGFVMQKMEKIRSKQKKNLLFGIVIILLASQLVLNIYLSYHSFTYPVDEIMKSIKKDGNVLVLTEDPVYSSVHVFYARTNKIPGNIIRPCLLLNNNLTSNLLEEWGVRYLIDQEQIIDNSDVETLHLKMVHEEKTENYDFKLFETNVKRMVNCNYICRLEGKVCEEGGLSGFLKLISGIPIGV